MDDSKMYDRHNLHNDKPHYHPLLVDHNLPIIDHDKMDKIVDQIPWFHRITSAYCMDVML